MLITVRAEIVKIINGPLYLFGSGSLQLHEWFLVAAICHS